MCALVCRQSCFDAKDFAATWVITLELLFSGMCRQVVVQLLLSNATVTTDVAGERLD
jgi:hypothetical protein